MTGNTPRPRLGGNVPLPAAMEPGRDDREHVRVRGTDRRRTLAAMEPGRDDREHKLCYVTRRCAERSRDGARSR